MTIKTLFLGLMAAGLIGSSHAAEADVRLEVEKDRETKVEARGDLDRDRESREREDRAYEREQKIRGENRASQLIGMEIWNRENQKLGVLKDVVLDLNSGNVSYVVLGSGGVLGFREKLIAIPPGQFTRHNTESVLVLDAEPSTIERMPGFAATNWPLESDSTWGPSAFLKMKEKEGERAEAKAEARVSTGGPATSETRTSKPRIYEDSKTFAGEITSVDPDGGKLTIRNQDGERKSFELERGEARSATTRALERTLGELKSGERVSVSYHTDASGKLVAHRIIRTGERD